MTQVKRTIEVDVGAEQFFEVITDFASYPEYMAKLGMKSCQVINKSETAAEVRSNVKTMGLAEKYTLRYVLDRPKKVSWSLVSGKLMKENTGSWELQSLGDDRTRAVYSIEASFGWMVPKVLVAKGIETQLPKMLDAFKNRAESLYG